jgi:hypothetical protein
LFLCLWAYAPAAAAQSAAAPAQLRAEELDDLVERIALYPDVLLKAILPASTFPDQIIDAALLIKTAKEAPLIKEQQWDESVKVIATYPGILKMMFDELAWTMSLGQAYLKQHRDVMEALQRVRAKAKEAGTLESNQHQKVTTETTSNGQTVIVVQPTTAETIYVPDYYGVGAHDDHDEYPLVPLASFGLGMALGAAVASDHVDHYYGPGYWGGGIYWHDDDDFDEWVDQRNERWEDRSDRRSDQQEARQDRGSDRQDFRQDMVEEGKWPAGGTENAAQRREQAQQRQDTRQANRSAVQSTSGGSPFDASTTSRDWGSSGAWSSSRSAQPRSASSSAFQGYNSGSRASAMSSRGAASRGRAGGFGGGGRRR